MSARSSIATILVMFGITSPVAAQTSWPRIADALPVGSEIVVKTNRGSILGGFVKIDASSISVMRHGNVLQIPATSVTRVRVRDRTQEGMGLGAVIGFTAGVAMAVVTTKQAHTPLEKEGAIQSWLILPGAGGLLGAGSGWLIGSFWPGKTVYAVRITVDVSRKR